MRSFQPQAIGNLLLAFRQLLLPPHCTLRMVQRKDAHCAILNVEVEEGISEERERVTQHVQNGIILRRYGKVKLGTVKLVVNLWLTKSIQLPFSYQHADLALTWPEKRPVSRRATRKPPFQNSQAGRILDNKRETRDAVAVCAPNRSEVFAGPAPPRRRHGPDGHVPAPRAPDMGSRLCQQRDVARGGPSRPWRTHW